MSPLACRACGEAVIPAPLTTRLGFSHEGGADHEVDLDDMEVTLRKPGRIGRRDPIADRRREKRLARLFGLPTGA